MTLLLAAFCRCTKTSPQSNVRRLFRCPLLNIAYIIVTIVMLCVTHNEHPNTLIRVWICVYSVLGLIHLIVVLHAPGVGRLLSFLVFMDVTILNTGGDFLQLTAPPLYWINHQLMIFCNLLANQYNTRL